MNIRSVYYGGTMYRVVKVSAPPWAYAVIPMKRDMDGGYRTAGSELRMQWWRGAGGAGHATPKRWRRIETPEVPLPKETGEVRLLEERAGKANDRPARATENTDVGGVAARTSMGTARVM